MHLRAFIEANKTFFFEGESTTYKRIMKQNIYDMIDFFQVFGNLSYCQEWQLLKLF